MMTLNLEVEGHLICKDLQAMISYRLFLILNPLGPTIWEILGLFDMKTILFDTKDVIWQSFYFQNKATITLR